MSGGMTLEEENKHLRAENERLREALKESHLEENCGDPDGRDPHCFVCNALAPQKETGK